MEISTVSSVLSQANLERFVVPSVEPVQCQVTNFYVIIGVLSLLLLLFVIVFILAYRK